jgi:very-short-patch-repair endonuclease
MLNKKLTLRKLSYGKETDMLKETVGKLILDAAEMLLERTTQASAARNENGYRLYKGVPVSKVQMELARLLRVPKQNINYKVGYYYADIAYPKDKIIIEYNGWFWHSRNSQKDAARTGYLLQHGWSLIIIKSNQQLPAIAVVRQALKKARQGHRYQEIVLPDWGKN